LIRWCWVVVVGCSAGWGCSSTGIWPFTPQRRPTSHEEVASNPSYAPLSVGAARPLRSGETLRVVDLSFEVVRVELPADSVRDSRKIWNHVDELRIDSDVVARLARNGLRVGAASSSAWPAIRTILEAGDATIRKEQLYVERGAPLTIELAAIQESESIFSYNRENRLVGKTYSGGRKLINVDYMLHPELGGSTDIRLTWEIRQEREGMTWERKEGVIQQTPAVDRQVFTDIEVVFSLNPGEFLVIGLSDQADNDYLLGSRFLMGERAGERFETVLCVTPQAYQTQSVRRPPT